MLSLETAHWRDIVGELIERTRTEWVVWFPHEEGDDAEWEWGYSCHFKASRMRFSVRSLAAENAVELCVRTRDPSGQEFVDTLRTNGTNTDPFVPLEVLHQTVQETVAAARRLRAQQNADITFRQLMDAIHGRDSIDQYLSVREFGGGEFHGHFDFDAPQWHELVDVVHQQTLQGRLVWRQVGTARRLQGQYFVILPGEISLGLAITEADECDELGLEGRFYELLLIDNVEALDIGRIGDLRKVQAVHGCEDDDMKDEQLAHCTQTLDALHDLLCHDLIVQDQAFRAIALEETFRGILASIDSGSDHFRPYGAFGSPN
ncbi:hypothetical protein ACTXOR_01450 [Arthrobacter rhombi]|uniref:hypothetical protein n=1 Tax=Arthrobacter rhombi TaxID=71253 RepID=UPI003FCF331E